MMQSSTEFLCIPRPFSPNVVTPILGENREINVGALLLTGFRLYLDFTSFFINVLILFQDPVQGPH